MLPVQRGDKEGVNGRWEHAVSRALCKEKLLPSEEHPAGGGRPAGSGVQLSPLQRWVHNRCPKPGVPPAFSLLLQVPSEGTRSPRPACEEGGRRWQAGGLSLPFYSSKHLPRERNPPWFLWLCLAPRGTSPPALPGCKGLCVAPAKWQGVRHSSAVTKLLPSFSPSLSFEMSLGWCVGILSAPHSFARTQEGSW